MDPLVYLELSGDITDFLMAENHQLGLYVKLFYVKNNQIARHILFHLMNSK